MTERAVADDLLRPTRGWVQVNVCTPADGVDPLTDQFGQRELRILYLGEAAVDPAKLPEPPDYVAEWKRTLRRIRRFIDQHGHARLPEPYHDDEGRLDIIVESLRWHHAGKGGIDPGPFPGVDYASDLDALPGWDWNLDSPS